MRNLKKILALALAFVMSLSLTITAGATDFSDDGSVSDTYRQAVEVLSELGVFNGDQNGLFNPDQPITRAEVAAILYRIATGDIGLEGNKTYAPYNQFPDVTAEDWFAGYVTYCANAGYIKGRNTGRFDAKDNVTGYEVLAMILRAVGYDKNNEFVGSDWQLHTASLAREKGVLTNVLEDPNVQLSNPATREVVAELLFRSSLLPQVSWNANTLSYVENGETLAYENLKMEQIEGVVVANEWADLRYDYIDVKAGQTVLNTVNGERTLEAATDLTDIGESRYAYVQNGSKVLGQLEDTGDNVSKDCVDLDPQGFATSVSALADGLSLKDAEYFVNFSDLSYDKSEYRIEYSVSFRNDEAKEWFEDNYLGQTRGADDVELEDYVNYYNVEWDYTTVNKFNDTGAESYFDDGHGSAVDTGAYNYLGRTFSRVIPAGETITWLDVAIMKGIFASAASFDSEHQNFAQLSSDIIHTGYVYAGTKSNPNTADRKDDLSDDYTYQKFADEYIGIAADAYFTSTTNGVWLKIVDNNADGDADYVLATVYDLVEVDSYNDRTGVYTFTGTADSDDAVCRDSAYEFAVGDMLLGAWIDGQYVVEESKSEIVVIEKYSWKDLSVTTKDGAVLYESGADIDNTTGYADRIADMAYGVEYEVFYDHYGFIRAYRPLSSERSYGLLTDLYLTNHRNTHYIDDQTATVELSYVDEDGKLDMHEYDVAGHSKTSPNVFVGVNQKVTNHATGETLGDTDNLQRAMAHLGMYTDRDVLRAVPTKNTVNGVYDDSTNTVLGDEFDYDTNKGNSGTKQSGTSNCQDDGYAPATNIDFSWTNVARYSFNEDGTVNLSTVSEYAYDKAGVQLYYWNGSTEAEKKANYIIGGERKTWADWCADYAENNDKKATDDDVIAAVNAKVVPVYAVDYVMLDKNLDGAASVNSGSYRFKIDASYDAESLYNYHVNAVSDTVFYVVTPKNVYPFIGYKNLPTIAKGDIHAMYAVAQNVTQDNAYTDYWVADVVVIETTAELAGVYGHMIYNVYDNYRAGQRGIIHELEAIDCTTGKLVKVVVDSSWTQPYDTGFYLLSGAETDDDGNITATGMITVEKDKTTNSYEYSDYGIYAGEVVRSSAITDRDSYIEVFNETTDKNVHGDEIRVELAGAPWYSVHGTATEAAKSAGRLAATQLADRDYSGNQPNGDEVIYVKYGNKVMFVIDTSFGNRTSWVTPAYLTDGWQYNEDGSQNYTGKDVYDIAMNEQTGEIVDTTATYTIVATVIDQNGNLVPTGEDVLKTTISPNTVKASATQATVEITVQYGKNGANWNSASTIKTVTGEATATKFGSTASVYVLTDIEDANKNGKIELTIQIEQDITDALISAKIAEIDTFIEPLDAAIVPDGYKWTDVGGLKWIESYWNSSETTKTIGAAVDTAKSGIQTELDAGTATLESVTNAVDVAKINATINAMQVALFNATRLTIGYDDDTAIMAAKASVEECVTKWNDSFAADGPALWLDGTALDDVISTWETAFKTIITIIDQGKAEELKASIAKVDGMNIGGDGKYYTRYTTVTKDSITAKDGWTILYVSLDQNYTGAHDSATSVNLRPGDNTIYVGVATTAKPNDWYEVEIVVTCDTNATTRPAD